MMSIIWALEIFDKDSEVWRVKAADHFPKRRDEWLREWYEEYQREQSTTPRRVKAYVRWGDVREEQQAAERATAWAEGPESKIMRAS